jgi:hypothetical protein
MNQLRTGPYEPTEQQPVPEHWRQALTRVAEAIASGDFGALSGVPGVEPVSEATAAQINAYVSGYPATLVHLPIESWDTSVCIFNGSEWEVLVDLWTQEEGRSDLVLHAYVGQGNVVRVHAVYVP